MNLLLILMFIQSSPTGILSADYNGSIVHFGPKGSQLPLALINQIGPRLIVGEARQFKALFSNLRITNKT